MINNRTDAWKTDVNLLDICERKASMQATRFNFFAFWWFLISARYGLSYKGCLFSHYVIQVAKYVDLFFLKQMRRTFSSLRSSSIAVLILVILAGKENGESKEACTDARCTCSYDKENITAVCRMSHLRNISQSFNSPQDVASLWVYKFLRKYFMSNYYKQTLTDMMYTSLTGKVGKVGKVTPREYNMWVQV